MAEQAIYAILRANGPVTALVGDRIAPASQAQFTAFPFVTYMVSDYEAIVSQAGKIAGEKTTVEVFAWGETYREAARLQLKIKLALVSKKGLYGGILVKNISVEGKSSLTEQVADGAEKPLYAISQNYTILSKGE